MFIKQAFCFYIQGFKKMTLGKTLWKLILIKLFVMFVLLKLFVFDENLSSLYKNDGAKSDFVLENLVKENNLKGKE